MSAEASLGVDLLQHGFKGGRAPMSHPALEQIALQLLPGTYRMQKLAKALLVMEIGSMAELEGLTT